MAVQAITDQCDQPGPDTRVPQVKQVETSPTPVPPTTEEALPAMRRPVASSGGYGSGGQGDGIGTIYGGNGPRGGDGVGGTRGPRGPVVIIGGGMGDDDHCRPGGARAPTGGGVLLPGGIYMPNPSGVLINRPTPAPTAGGVRPGGAVPRRGRGGQ